MLWGAGLLCGGALAIIFGDSYNNRVVIRYGIETAVLGTVLYFAGRIGGRRK